MAELLKLNLGCGRKILPGFVNIDSSPLCKPDRLLDLERTPWPFDDVSVGEVYATHILEHLGQSPSVFLGVVKELYRVMASNATCRIVVPHPRSDFFVSDPTHVRPITPQMMSLFSKHNCREAIARGWSNSLIALELDVDFELDDVSYVLSEAWSRRRDAGTLPADELDRAMRSQWNVIDEIQMVIRKVSN